VKWLYAYDIAWGQGRGEGKGEGQGRGGLWIMQKTEKQFSPTLG